MKKRSVLLCCLSVLLLLGIASAVGGDSSDPLVSLRYLEGLFTDSAEKSVDAALDKSDASVYQTAKSSWDESVAMASFSAGAEYTAVTKELHIKQLDTVSGTTGLQLIPIAGEVTVSFSSGSVVDVTDGKEIESGKSLQPMHRYLTAEDTFAVFTAIGKTALINVCGKYLLSPSAQPDYVAMAGALKALHLFRGTDTAYGRGYDLEKIPTRIQALIMLIRLLGEEDAALACTAEHPFKDVPSWANCYVAYAYEKGYSNGVGETQFGTNIDASALMYTEFVLRALGYSSTQTTDISDALLRAVSAKLLNEKECTLLQTTDFLRADVVYLSYYALDTRVSGGRQLQKKLISAHVFTTDEYRAARAGVTSQRLA